MRRAEEVTGSPGEPRRLFDLAVQEFENGSLRESEQNFRLAKSKALGIQSHWKDASEAVANAVKHAEGSIQEVEAIPDDLKEVYRTAWEIPMRSLIDMGADRGAFIDQSQSLNLFIESPTIGKLSSMYLHAWKSGLKTTYYLRSRPATRINKTTVDTTTGTNGAGHPDDAGMAREFTDSEAVACSLENPETCEACD